MTSGRNFRSQLQGSTLTSKRLLCTTLCNVHLAHLECSWSLNRSRDTELPSPDSPLRGSPFQLWASSKKLNTSGHKMAQFKHFHSKMEGWETRSYQAKAKSKFSRTKNRLVDSPCSTLWVVSLQEPVRRCPCGLADNSLPDLELGLAQPVPVVFLADTACSWFLHVPGISASSWSSCPQLAASGTHFLSAKAF